MRRRIGILIGSLRGGGAERSALRLFSGLNAKGIDAWLLVLDSNNDFRELTQDGWLPEYDDRVLHLGSGDVHRATVRKVVDAPLQWFRLMRLIRRYRLGVVVSMMERANILNLIGAMPVRRILSVRSHIGKALASKEPLKRRLIKVFYRLFLRRADRIVFNAQLSLTAFRDSFSVPAEKCALVHNFCDVTRLDALADAELPAEMSDWFGAETLLACGRLSDEKGVWQLLRVFARLAAERPQVRLLLVGKGPAEDRLRQLAADLGVTDRVLFAGFQANPMSWMRRADIVVLPSLWEGFPNTLLEAMAVGTAVVATDCRSGPRELLAPDTAPATEARSIETTSFGLLTPPLDAAQHPAGQPLNSSERCLAEALTTLLDAPQLRRELASAARRRAADFDPQRVLPAWLELIGQLEGS